MQPIACGTGPRPGGLVLVIGLALANVAGGAAHGQVARQDGPLAAAARVMPASSARSLCVYRSQHLIVHTDLPSAAAKAALDNLQRTLTHAAKYWGEEPRGQIQCYLLHDLDNVNDSELPHRLARVLVGGVGGATLPGRSGSVHRHLPTVLASTRPGVAAHEVVHAYCTQTFGFTGPDWYKEGMAEIVTLGCTRKSGVQCSPQQIQQLREGHRVPIGDVRHAGATGQKILASLQQMLSDPKNRNRQIPLADWRPEDAHNVVQARREYLHCWALCYMLLHNPNYASRFRLLGRKYVGGHKDSFESLFSSMEREMLFEYSFFLRNVGVGYRVDLCSWDWHRRFQPFDPAAPTVTQVAAGKGYQASGLMVTAGEKYSYRTEGTWKTSPHLEATGADGSGQRGQLIGVVLNDFRLSEPFPLGVRGSFEAPITGKLYLRCNDAWHEVHDNQGEVTLTIE